MSYSVSGTINKLS